MSVINKMLRDLDQRKPSPIGQDGAQPVAEVRQGTSTVDRLEGSRRKQGARNERLWLALAFAAVAAGATGWWWQMRSPAVPAGTAKASDSSDAVASLSPVVPAASSPASAPVAPEAAQPKTTPGKSIANTQGTVNRPEPKPSRTDSAAASKVHSTDSAPLDIALRMETALELRSLREPATTTRAVPVAGLDRPRSAQGAASGPTASAANAAQDALSQAQTLWNAGSRDAAVELLRDGVAIAERGGPGSGNTALIPLVRELTRMQLADGHFGAVWDLLSRLEPHLGNHADLWAIRANAAQRLGRHQDSVHAYMVALQSRPAEQRWLLGSAVSLAALGQTSSAVEMADKARAAGPISKDVLAYLRQMNVPIKD